MGIRRSVLSSPARARQARNEKHHAPGRDDPTDDGWNREALFRGGRGMDRSDVDDRLLPVVGETLIDEEDNAHDDEEDAGDG